MFLQEFVGVQLLSVTFENSRRTGKVSKEEQSTALMHRLILCAETRLCSSLEPGRFRSKSLLGHEAS